MTANRKKTEILFVIPNLDGGGAERTFVNYIRALDRERFQINLLLVERTGIFLGLIPSHVGILDLGEKRTRHSFFKLIKYIRHIKPQLIVSTLNRMNILVLLASSFLPKEIKIILYEPSMPSAQFGTKYLPGFYLWLIRWLYPRAYKIIAQTEAMKAEIQSYFKIPPDKIHVLVNPVDTEFIAEKLRDAENPFQDDCINVVAAGRIREEKGFDFLIRSFAKVLRQNDSFRLHILGKEFGDGSHKRQLLELVAQLGLQNSVFFIGFQMNPFPFYKFADLFVLSSRWEGLPNVVLENLYLKKPVIVTDCIPFFREIIQDGKNGFIVDFGDEEAMADRILRYGQLKVEEGYRNRQDLNQLFESLYAGG